jgi:hypothetical protein
MKAVRLPANVVIVLSTGCTARAANALDPGAAAIITG